MQPDSQSVHFCVLSCVFASAPNCAASSQVAIHTKEPWWKARDKHELILLGMRKPTPFIMLRNDAKMQSKKMIVHSTFNPRSQLATLSSKLDAPNSLMNDPISSWPSLAYTKTVNFVQSHGALAIIILQSHLSKLTTITQHKIIVAPSTIGRPQTIAPTCHWNWRRLNAAEWPEAPSCGQNQGQSGQIRWRCHFDQFLYEVRSIAIGQIFAFMKLVLFCDPRWWFGQLTTRK